jgi:N-methylhydantoinase B
VTEDKKVDPVTQTLIRSALVGICDQMFATLVHSSHSPNITERHDCSCSIYTPAGQMCVVAEHIPAHLGVMPQAIHGMLARLPAKPRPGDLLLTNDPYSGANHLPDLILAAPLFVGDRLMGYAAALSHHNDVGGIAPRSMPGDATEIFQEGLRIPPISAGRDWQLSPAVVTLISGNSRLPEQRVSDLNAQVSALRTAQGGITELCEEYGAQTVTAAQEALLDASEAAIRRRLREMPDGKWHARTAADPGGKSIPIEVAITKQGDQMSIDFAGTGPQTPTPYNAPIANSRSAVSFALQVLLGEDILPNAGFYRPFSIIVPPGSILNANYPAAISASTSVTEHVFDALQAALSDVFSQRIMAGSGYPGVFSFGGWQDSRPYAYGGALGGGLGAGFGLDGENGVKAPLSNTRDISVEALEAEYPIRQLRYELIDNSGGAGQWPGGLGIRYVYELLHDSTCSFQPEFTSGGPPGIRGGEPGQRSVIWVTSPSGETTTVDRFLTVDCQRGSVIHIESAGGGGYGAAENRKIAAAEHHGVARSTETAPRSTDLGGNHDVD